MNKPPSALGFQANAISARADLMVSAWRIFSAALRVCRRLGMERRRAYMEAVDCALRHTGVDWSKELTIDLGVDTLPTEIDPRPDTQVALFLQRWKQGDLGIPYSSIRSLDLFDHYLADCDRSLDRTLNMPRFIHAVVRQFGRGCNSRRRWVNAAGTTQGPNGFIDPPCMDDVIAAQSAVRIN